MQSNRLSAMHPINRALLLSEIPGRYCSAACQNGQIRHAVYNQGDRDGNSRGHEVTPVHLDAAIRQTITDVTARTNAGTINDRTNAGFRGPSRINRRISKSCFRESATSREFVASLIARSVSSSLARVDQEELRPRLQSTDVAELATRSVRRFSKLWPDRNISFGSRLK